MASDPGWNLLSGAVDHELSELPVSGGVQTLVWLNVKKTERRWTWVRDRN